MTEEADPLRLASLYVSIQRPDKALEALQNADPNDARTFAFRGEALIRLNRFADAERELRRGLELDPENLAALTLLAQAQLPRDAWAAESTVKNAYALDPENPHLLATHVLALMAQGRYEAAERILQRGMAVAPEEMQPIRTIFLLRASGSKDALEAAQQLLRESPDDAAAHYLQGLALLRSGHPRRAMRHLREAAALRPEERLFTAAARTFGAWYLWPVHVTAGAVHIVTTAVLFIGAFAAMLLTQDSSAFWIVLGPWLAFTAYKWIAVGLSALLLYRRWAK